MRFHVNPYWVNTDIEALAMNWVVDQDGIDRRQGCRAQAGTVMAQAANNFAGTHPRSLFWFTLPFLANGACDWPAHTNASVDMLEFLWDRTYKQGREATLSTISMPRKFVNAIANPPGVNSFLELDWSGTYGGALHGHANTQIYAAGMDSANYFTDSYGFSDAVNIGNPTGLVEFGTIINHAGFHVVDLAIQEDAAIGLDDALNHTHADPTLAKPGRFVLADIAEQVRVAVHELRSTNLPVVFCWSSMGGVANPDWASPGSLRGMAVNAAVDGTNWVNLLDHTISARNSATPGTTGYAQYAALGLNTAVPVTCYVLGQRAVSSGDAQVRFETEWSNATVDLTYNGTGTLGWVGCTGLLMNSATRDDDTDNGNKIDFFGHTDGCAMTIYAMVGITQYG